ARVWLPIAMLRNYFKSAWRGILRGRSFSIINILGLIVGMAGATLILLWLINEISYDRFHVNRDRIYQVYAMTDIPGEKHTCIGVVSQPLGPAMKARFPDVESFARLTDVDHFLVTTGGKSFTKLKGDFVDPDFLRIFTFPLVAGDRNDPLGSVNSILLTERLARKLFGTADAVGRTVRLDSVDNFTVTGVLKDLPANTEFDFEYLLPWSYLKKLGWNNDNWISNNSYTFLLLRPHTDVGAFNLKIRDLTRINTGRKDLWVHFVYPLSQWHLYSEFDNGIPAGGRIDTVRVFALIAAFILLIACINFMNLSTARSERRAKEVGIRKVAGAGRGLLIGQFMAESFLTVFVSGIIALAAVQWLLPAFGRLAGTPLAVPYGSAAFWLGAGAFLLMTSVLAGAYPAFYLSAFKPVSIFRKEFRRAPAALSARKVLVVLQFCFAILLIISTLVVRDQLQYTKDRDAGYSRNNLIYVEFEGDIERNYPLIRQDLLQSGIAVAVSKNFQDIADGGPYTWGYRWPGEPPHDTTIGIRMFSTDAGLVHTMGMHLLAGRDIDIYQHPTDSFALILNETAVKWMGFQDPIGQIIYNPYEHTRWHVVGVVRDYVNGTPYGRVPPVMIQGPASTFTTMHIRFNPANSTSASLEKAAAIFKRYNPAYPFDYRFVDQEFAGQFEDAQRTKTMAGLFAALAIFISCLGLFGLSAFVAESRFKEIGVRKVLGASASGIARLLSADFIRLVLIAFAIAAPIAWDVMNRWLANFDYRISLGWAVFALAGFLAVAIALLTVSFQAVRAASVNPVDSLRAD
ncbi:MAG TPA: ABC transporter permease, partial [Puia sp.]|nr:ABC transporter permease [Puia sp.]